MRYLASRIIFAIGFGFLLIGSCVAQTRVRVVETAIRIQFHLDSTFVILPLENQTGEATASHVHLELIDPRGVVQTYSDQDVSVPVGSTKFDLSLPPASCICPERES